MNRKEIWLLTIPAYNQVVLSADTPDFIEGPRCHRKLTLQVTGLTSFVPVEFCFVFNWFEKYENVSHLQNSRKMLRVLLAERSLIKQVRD